MRENMLVSVEIQMWQCYPNFKSLIILFWGLTYQYSLKMCNAVLPVVNNLKKTLWSSF